MTCEIELDCSKCGKVVFGNAQFPEEVKAYIHCPSCGDEARVVNKQLVLGDVTMYVERVPAVMIDKYAAPVETMWDGKYKEDVADGKGKIRKRKE